MSVASITPTGIPLSVVVSALDRFGNAGTGYTGTVHFASSDPQAVLPADYTFTAADAGSHTFTATLKTAGTQTLSVTDTANPAFNSQAQISVITVVPASFEFFELPTTTSFRNLRHWLSGIFPGSPMRASPHAGYISIIEAACSLSFATNELWGLQLCCISILRGWRSSDRAPSPTAHRKRTS